MLGAPPLDPPLPVCDAVHRGAWGRVSVPRSKGVSNPRQTPPSHWQNPPPPPGDGRRSGRYASSCNAFLFSLINSTNIFCFVFKAKIEKDCPEILKLGLLSEVGTRTAGVKEQKRSVSYHHKSLQEFSSAKHIVKKLKASKNVKVYLNSISGEKILECGSGVNRQYKVNLLSQLNSDFAKQLP